MLTGLTVRRDFGAPFDFSVQRRSALCALALLAGGVLPLSAHAGSFELRVVTRDDGDATKKILELLRQRYPTLQTSHDADRLATRSGAAVFVSIGPGALANALATDRSGPLISIFTSNESFVRLTASASERRPRPPVTAIYAEASPLQQMQLIRRLYGRRVAVGVLLSQHTKHLESMLRSAAQSWSLDIDLQYTEGGDNILRALTRLSSVSVILAIPDSSIYTPESLRNILESTYRRNQAVIGFSTALVQAGTLATAYAGIDDTLSQLPEIVDAVAAGRKVEAQYPIYWRVAVNDNVARSMNIVVEDDVRLMGRRRP